MFPSAQGQGQGNAATQGQRRKVSQRFGQQQNQATGNYEDLRPSAGGFGQKPQQSSFGAAVSGAQSAPAWGQGAQRGTQPSFGAAPAQQAQPQATAAQPWGQGARGGGQQNPFGATAGQQAQPQHPWARAAQQPPRAQAALVQQPGQTYNFNTGQMEADTQPQAASWSQGARAQAEPLMQQPGQAFNFNTGQMEAEWGADPGWAQGDAASQMEDPFDSYGLRKRQSQQQRLTQAGW
ncbi:MAG TPA: hypothetical protein VN428_02360 [Bryobacteraceae bacterium]|nr:hypothetical protein [Bryobacteraceae bacterium]